MSTRDLGDVDRDLEALDEGRALEAKGRSSASAAFVRGLDRVDAALDELAQGVDLALVANESASEPGPGTNVREPVASATGERPMVVDQGVDPELSFDDLFDDVPAVESASKPLTALPPPMPDGKSMAEAIEERMTTELDPEEIAALDSLEIVLDD